MVRWPRSMIVAVLVLSGCATANAPEAEAPSLSFEGPLHPVALSAAQIKIVQQGIAANLKGPATFGDSYRAGISMERQIVVCGHVNGTTFQGMFAKDADDGSTVFLPIVIGLSDEDRALVRRDCRYDGIFISHTSELKCPADRPRCRD
jgi:hypothetical protein